MKFLNHYIALPCLVFSLAAILTACETPNDNTVEQVRQCVNQATSLSFTNPTQAAQNATNICDAEITSSGLQTPEAQQLTFGIILVEQQKISQIAQMATALGSNSGGIAGINGAIAVMVFSTQSSANRIQLVGNTLGGSFQALGNVIQLATVLSLAGTVINSSSPASALASLQALANCTGSDAGASCAGNQSAAASSVLAAQAGACAPGSQNSALCTSLTAATGGATTPAQVLQNMATYAASPH